MKTKLTNILCVVAGMSALTGGESFAQGGFQALPVEIGAKVFLYLNREEDLVNRLVNRLASAIIGNMNPNSFKKRFERIEKLLELDQFISLHGMPQVSSTSDMISHIGVSQELWFEVMGNNPSEFKEEKYCPETYKVLDGIEMCSDF